VFLSPQSLNLFFYSQTKSTAAVEILAENLAENLR
jgi:hypothetical protein